ncbi:MAG: segregation/condensation protein A [Chloroflexi bacterium]|nr:segregation/condensation protein A [Chloroflexota bacterium]
MKVGSNLQPPTSSPLELRLDGFQGPIELLLTLIEKRKLPITSVSLAAVADQYLAHIRSLPELDADLLADFLVVAAKLLLIKSRAILPGQPTAADEEEDPAQELEARLQEYRVFRAAAQYLQSLEQQGGRCYPHPPRVVAPAGPAPLEPIAPMALAAVLTRMLEQRLRRSKKAAEVTRLVRASVEARMALVLERLEASPSLSWGGIAGQRADEVVATFLAVLELLKRGLVRVDQEGIFGAIVVRRAA